MKSQNLSISKSKYLHGLQCDKLLWYDYNAKEEIPAPDAVTQTIFDQGTAVGELAQKLYPDGIKINAEHFEIEKILEESKKALILRKPLFEAGFQYDAAFARVDILNPVGKDAWDIIEVKSSTEVKEINLHDLAHQWYVYAGAGLNIRSCSICHINNQYVRKGEREPKKLFTIEDVTSEVTKLLPQVKKNLKRMHETISLPQCPEVNIGPQCEDPYTCALMDKCWSFLPKHSVFTVYRLGKKAFNLLEHGITDLKDIPDDFGLSEIQHIQINAVRSGKPFIDRDAIKTFLDELQYPLYFLDFETFATAIPLFDEVRPYQSIPFQFSLHIQESSIAKPKHISFLADGKNDPRPEILKLLKESLGTEGSIVAYNMSFEKGRLNEMAETYTQFQRWNESVQKRFIDLLEPFRSLVYYHPEQMGSASIKAVLPVLTGKSYSDMEIGYGGVASNEYVRVTFQPCEDNDRERVRKLLEEYCEQDTLGMIWIINELQKKV